jgi:hypothetical protein
MSLGWSVVLFNFGVIIVVYLIGRVIDAAAGRYDSKETPNSQIPISKELRRSL